MPKGSSLILACLILLAAAPCPAGPARGRPFAQTQITFDLRADRETVCLALNGLAQPVLSTLEGDRPRIVLDIFGVARWEGRSSIAADGTLIRQVRAYLDRPSGRLRLVLDLAPDINYGANPVYYRENDLFCLTVRQEKP